MAKLTQAIAEPTVPKAEPELEMPTEGGSYTRHPDTKALVPTAPPTEVPASPAPKE